MADLTHLLSDSQQRLLQLLKREGSLTVDRAIDQLDLAETTIRQHLGRLTDAGLVEQRAEARGRGRPTAVYTLDDRGQQLFPAGDAQLLSDLLGFLSREGYHRAIDEFFRDFWRQRHAAFEQRLDEASAEDLGEVVAILKDFLAEKGFMPEVDLDDSEGELELSECNCPLAGAVEQTRLPCRLEAEFLERALGRALKRVEYIPDGNNACTYQFDDDK
jgi:predicted ArsR family transcriptional regulator